MEPCHLQQLLQIRRILAGPEWALLGGPTAWRLRAVSRTASSSLLFHGRQLGLQNIHFGLPIWWRDRLRWWRNRIWNLLGFQALQSLSCLCQWRHLSSPFLVQVDKPFLWSGNELATPRPRCWLVVFSTPTWPSPTRNGGIPQRALENPPSPRVPSRAWWLWCGLPREQNRGLGEPPKVWTPDGVEDEQDLSNLGLTGSHWSTALLNGLANGEKAVGDRGCWTQPSGAAVQPLRGMVPRLTKGKREPNNKSRCVTNNAINRLSKHWRRPCDDNEFCMCTCATYYFENCWKYSSVISFDKFVSFVLRTSLQRSSILQRTIWNLIYLLFLKISTRITKTEQKNSTWNSFDTQ